MVSRLSMIQSESRGATHRLRGRSLLRGADLSGKSLWPSKHDELNLTQKRTRHNVLRKHKAVRHAEWQMLSPLLNQEEERKRRAFLITGGQTLAFALAAHVTTISLPRA